MRLLKSLKKEISWHILLSFIQAKYFWFQRKVIYEFKLQKLLRGYTKPTKKLCQLYNFVQFFSSLHFVEQGKKSLNQKIMYNVSPILWHENSKLLCKFSHFLRCFLTKRISHYFKFKFCSHFFKGLKLTHANYSLKKANII